VDKETKLDEEDLVSGRFGELIVQLEPSTFGEQAQDRKPTRYHCAKTPVVALMKEWEIN
jgi:hypothetical protein